MIFDHIHRRQSEIKSILGSQRESERPYEQLQYGDVLDLIFIRDFFGTLTTSWNYENRDKMVVHCEANVRLEAAAESLGIKEPAYSLHSHFGIGLAFIVMYPS
ncbi:hypothetical protein [Rhizobium leguminosarum]|uniref:hypothetical protein n=1 Tax=Rhizobium leguminosarum TaxID=384 RepID=UPI001C96F050|nr:hypothetical protein [Rhizobium leguminosarum]MBY5666845.1 hypothetical protein [Rhizobium leguminosarum]MBY5680466.1 hypothetical protein [Rhizobium leguminosarum]